MEKRTRFCRDRVDPELRRRARAMRHEPAPAEKKLWSRLRNHQLGGYQFRRQYVVRGFIADFYCPSARLVVELDGDSHDGREGYDARRSEVMAEEGLHVMRFVNTDVFENLDSVLEAILSECQVRAGSVRNGPPTPALPPEYRGEGVRGVPLR